MYWNSYGWDNVLDSIFRYCYIGNNSTYPDLNLCNTEYISRINKTCTFVFTVFLIVIIYCLANGVLDQPMNRMEYDISKNVGNKHVHFPTS
eukprot:SAG31_NODE_2240_length_6111_cov_11.710246_8_plen_91_part_00